MMMKQLPRALVVTTLALLSMLICSSCTSMLMDSGQRPWELYGQPKSAVTDTYGQPVLSGQKHEQLDQALQTQRHLRSSWTSYSHYGIHRIRGPFPEPDVTKSLEALYASVCTLGLAEIVMLPPTAIAKLLRIGDVCGEIVYRQCFTTK